MFVPGLEEFFDGFYQVIDAEERPSPNSFRGQFSKPSLDEIQPTGTCRHKVRHEAWVSLQPATHLLVTVRAIVVHHQVQGDVAGKLVIQPPEELQKLLVPVTLVTLSDDLSLQQVQRGEQRRGAVTFL